MKRDRELAEAVRAAREETIERRRTRRRERKEELPSQLVSKEEMQSRMGRLTRMERRVFCLAAKGTSNAGIARICGMRVSTVKTHRNRINKKLGTHRPVELVLLAQRVGVP